MWKLPIALAVFFIAGTSAKNGDINWEYLSTTFALSGGFYNIPLTLTEFLEADSNYTFMTYDPELNVDFFSYPNDPRVSIGFDSYGNVAAVRMGILKADIDNRAVSNGVPYNYTYENKPLYTSGNFWGIDVYYSTALFASPETLAAGGRAETSGLVAEEVYMPINGSYIVMPKYECDAPSIGFTKGGCFDYMGIHYIQDMNSNMPCGAHEGPFLIYVDGDLVSLGWFPFGTFTTNERVWFEDPPAYLTAVFAPHAPDCFSGWADQYGVISFHIFLKQYPKTVKCSAGANITACA